MTLLGEYVTEKRGLSGELIVATPEPVVLG